ITGASGYTMFKPSIAWDGINYIVAYNIEKNFGDEDIYVTRVSSTGRVLDANGIALRTGAGNQNEPFATRGANGGAEIVWNDASYAGDVQSATISGAGLPGPVIDVSAGAPRQSLPRIAANGSGYLVVFRSEVSFATRILAQRLDASGAAIDQEPF